MSWKNLTLAKKSFLGTTVFILLVVFLSGWALVGINDIIGSAVEVTQTNNLRNQILQRQIEHINWAAELADYVDEDLRGELMLETDPHKCAFGLWFYGEGTPPGGKSYPGVGPGVAKN